MRLGIETPQRALAIVAHPDDAEFQCGATLARWAAEGCEVHHLVCTDGSKGTWDVEADTAALVALRQDEQQRGGPVVRAAALLLFEADEPDLVVDVTGFADRKVAALLEHVSQFVTTHEITDPSDEAQVARFRRVIEDRLSEHGRAGGVRHGERFKLLDRL